jgi:hypothetical protein
MEGRRRILHFNVTEYPTGLWIVQQLREAFPESCSYRYAILDGDAKFGEDVTELLTASGMNTVSRYLRRLSALAEWSRRTVDRKLS